MTTPLPDSSEHTSTAARNAALWLLIPGIVAFAVVFYANRFGADVLPDSGDYITAGVRFAHGEGISMANRVGDPQPLTWFPPLFPLVISGIEMMHLPIYRSVGVFQAGCCALLVWAAGMLVTRCTGRLMWGLIAGFSVGITHAIYYVHSICLSEPLFLLWVVGSLWSLNRWQRAGGRFAWAVATGAMIAGAILTRYAGASLLPAAGLVCLITGGVRFWRRCASAALLGVVGLAPIMLWSWHHKPAGDTATGRHMELHLIGWDKIQDGMETLAGFIIPDQFHPHVGTGMILLIAVALAIAGSAVYFRSSSTPRVPAGAGLISICSIFTVIYIAFLVVSISLFDKDTPLDERLLSPVLVPLVVVALGWLARLWLIGPKLRVGICLGVLTLMALHALDIRSELRQRQSQDDLAWSPTVDSETMDELKKIPPEQNVFSDKPCAIFMTSRIRTELLPDRPAHPETDPQDAQDLQESIQILRDKLTTSGGGWIVFWHQLDDFGDGFLTEKDVRAHFVIADETRCEDGILLMIDTPESDPAEPATVPTTAPATAPTTAAAVLQH
jgi:hypothetical protein